MTPSREVDRESDQARLGVSAAAKARTAHVTSRRILLWLIAVGWLLFLAAIATQKPGELLELVVLSAVASFAWWVVRGGTGAAPIALGLFLVPLVNTWPARVLQLVPDRLVVPLPAFFSVGSVLIVLLIIVVRPHWPSLPVRLVAVGMPFLLAGALSTISAQHHLDAFGQAWLAFAVPIGLGLLVASTRATWTAATTLLLGFVTPAIVGIAAYLLSFGVPLSGADLVRAKAELYRPHLFQDVTFGNVDHIADIALLLLPLAFLAPVAWRRDRLMRVVSTMVALVILCVLVLVLSRSTLLVAIVMLAGVAGLLAIRGHWGAVAPVAGVAIIALVLLLPEVRGLYAGILPTAAVVVQRAPPSPSPVLQSPAAASPDTNIGPATVVGSASDASTSDRIAAIRDAISFASAHGPFGVGTGQYVRFDPAQTAPHSLLAILIVENGVLGGLGLLLLLAILSERLFRIARSRTIDDGALLQLGALAGAFGFIVEGILAGVPLALGTIDVWAVCLWCLIAIGMTSADPSPLPEGSRVLPARRFAPVAVVFAVLIAVAISAFPLALEPGSADRNGVVLNSLVDSADPSGPNDWYRATPQLEVTGNRQRMELVLSQRADLQPLVISRPVAVFPSTCYDVSVSRVKSTTSLMIELADEEGRQVIETMSLSSGLSDNVHLRVRSGDRFRVSILFIGQGPIDVDIGTVRVNRLSSCY